MASRARQGTRNAASVSRQVAAHYTAFPYRKLGPLEAEASNERMAGTLDNLLRRRGATRFNGRRLRIWVAGCGTTQAAQVAPSWPDADVLGTDLSTTSLRIARRLARDIGVGNLCLERGDLLDSRAQAAFDLVFCTGVLHHLADPLAGLRTILRSLTPSGAAVLMLYNRMHRAPLDRVRHAVRATLGGRVAAARRLDAARAVLDAIDDARHPSPFGAMLRALRNEHRQDVASFADMFVNPQERAFDIDELLLLLENAGARLASWVMPAEWQPERLFRAGSVRDHLRRLSAVERWRLSYWLGGPLSPLFRFIVERRDQKPGAPWRETELRALRVRGPETRTIYGVRDGRATPARRVAVASTRSNALHLRFRSFHGDDVALTLPASLAPVIRRAEEGATIGALASNWPAAADTATRRGILHGLLPDGFGYLSIAAE